DVAEIDADAKFDPLPLGDVGVARGHAVLHVDCAAHRFDRACELGEHAVAGGLDQPPLMLGDFRLDQLAPVRPEPVDRAFLVGPDEPRVTRDVRSENGGKPTFHGWLLLRGGPTGGPALGCRGLIIWGLRRRSAGGRGTCPRPAKGHPTTPERVDGARAHGWWRRGDPVAGRGRKARAAVSLG